VRHLSFPQNKTKMFRQPRCTIMTRKSCHELSCRLRFPLLFIKWTLFASQAFSSILIICIAPIIPIFNSYSHPESTRSYVSIPLPHFPPFFISSQHHISISLCRLCIPQPYHHFKMFLAIPLPHFLLHPTINLFAPRRRHQPTPAYHIRCLFTPTFRLLRSFRFASSYLSILALMSSPPGVSS